jgi:hypothetical protein
VFGITPKIYAQVFGGTVMKKGLLLLALLSSFSVQAYDDSYDFDSIDIDGNFSEKRESQAERMKKMRAQLEKKNEEMIRNQIERARYQQEMEMMRALQQKMNAVSKQLQNL